MVKNQNRAFIALIPKVGKPKMIKDYRPICLVSFLYKVLSKVLANKLRKIMDSIIGETHMAFVPKYQISDSYVIAEEIINKWKFDKMGGLLVKLDFEKAYDSVDNNFFVFLNGSPTSQFGVEKGLRKLYVVSWGKACKRKDMGGFGIKRMLDKNRAMLMKWTWRFDGSMIGNPGPSGIGRVSRDSNERVLRLFSYYIGILDSNTVESWAIKRAVKLVLSNPNLRSHDIMVSVDGLKVVFDSRIFNSFADSLATMGSSMSEDFEEWEDV
ncbi:hypothetical protein Ddye_000874 [Dipteronia dyeriana]|uniref:Reverse transcriptase domain-containing protein n=1 Tax=Dipteronia dyeriana TaxID=168575 RepID=A0AAD9XN57_9ROSI|nr:hypothetical protein Ddye_000874 [Dipteronia dyeriana]